MSDRRVFLILALSLLWGFILIGLMPVTWLGAGGAVVLWMVCSAAVALTMIALAPWNEKK